MKRMMRGFRFQFAFGFPVAGSCVGVALARRKFVACSEKRVRRIRRGEPDNFLNGCSDEWGFSGAGVRNLTQRECIRKHAANQAAGLASLGRQIDTGSRVVKKT
jgi:hypothetical protein